MKAGRREELIFSFRLPAFHLQVFWLLARIAKPDSTV